MTDQNNLAADDLALVDALADQAKGEDDIWNEFEAADAAKTEKPEPAPANEEDASDEPTAEAGAEAAKAEPAPVEAPKATDAKGAEAGPDIWANAPPELKAAYDELQQKFRSVNGRTAAFQRRYEDLKKIVEAPAQQRRPGSAREALAAIKNDYPDVAGPIEEALSKIEERLDAQDQAEESRRSAARDELVGIITSETERLNQAIPDWEVTLQQNGKAFAAWVEDQPRRVREAAYRNAQNIVDAEEAAQVIAAFKAHIMPAQQPAAAPTTPTPIRAQTQPLTDRRARQLDATASPRSARRPTVSGIPEDGDPQAIWDAFDAQERARA